MEGHGGVYCIVTSVLLGALFFMMKIETLKFLPFFLLILFPLSSQAKEVKGIILKEILSIGSVDDDILYEWAGITTDPAGNIYLTDSIDCHIKKFSKEGKLLKKGGGKGQGPGEFLAPRLIKYFKNAIYVNDQYIPGIQIFDEELNYKGKILLKVPVFDFKVINEELMALTTLTSEKTFYIYFYDRNGNLKEKIPYYISEDISKNMLGLAKFEIDKNGNFYIIFVYQDIIEKLDSKGNPIWRKSLFKGEKSKMEKSKYGPFALPENTIYKDIEIDRNGYIYILTGSIAENRSRDVYVLSPKGDYITKFTLQDTTHLIHIDSENNIYSRAEMGVTLKKYSIIFRF